VSSCRPCPPSPARRKSPSPRCARAAYVGCSCTCADYRCSHSIAVSADRWPDEVQLSDMWFTCTSRGNLRRTGCTLPPFTSIAEHRERRIACESIPGLLVHRDLLHRQRPRSLLRGIAEIGRPPSVAEEDARDPQVTLARCITLYRLPCPLVRDKLPTSEGRFPVDGDVPKSPFIGLGRAAAVGRHDLSGDCRLFWLSIQIPLLRLPQFACRFPSGQQISF
jgi:hypothetical protein